MVQTARDSEDKCCQDLPEKDSKADRHRHEDGPAAQRPSSNPQLSTCTHHLIKLGPFQTEQIRPLSDRTSPNHAPSSQYLKTSHLIKPGQNSTNPTVSSQQIHRPKYIKNTSTNWAPYLDILRPQVLKTLVVSSHVPLPRCLPQLAPERNYFLLFEDWWVGFWILGFRG